MQRLIYFIICIVLAVLLYFAVSLWFIKGEASPIPATQTQSLPIRTESPIDGSRQAPIVIQVFSSYTCPACKQTAETLAQLRAQNRQTVAVVYRDYPFDTDEARLLAQAGRCAQMQGKFWPYHDLLFANQRPNIGQSQLSAFARQLELEIEAFDRCLNQNETIPLIEQDIADGDFLEIDALPYFDVSNQVRISGHIDQAQWQRIISDLRK